MKNLDDVGVVIVDMQDKYLRDKEKKRIVPPQKKLLDFAKENDLPVFLLEYLPGGPTIPELRENIEGYENVVVEKKYNDDGFIVRKNIDGKYLWRGGDISIEGDSNLDLDLKEKGIKKLLVAGVNKSACVRSTIEGANKRGYKVFTATDLMNEPIHGNRWYSQNTGYTISTDKLLKKIKK
ncbi:isochorismatase family protein [archaeon]|jgi:nicotinamidase-related amidase|nr:isochorismatase family protein [archaeon]